MSSDDIVTRLREHIPIPLEFADEGAPAHLIAEAADEIERLRTDLADWQRTVRALEDELFMAEKWRDNYEIGLNDYKKLAEHWHNKAKGNE